MLRIGTVRYTSKLPQPRLLTATALAVTEPFLEGVELTQAEGMLAPKVPPTLGKNGDAQARPEAVSLECLCREMPDSSMRSQKHDRWTDPLGFVGQTGPLPKRAIWRNLNDYHEPSPCPGFP